MDIFLQIGITLALAALVFGVFWSAFGKLRMPVRSTGEMRVHTILSVRGRAEGLEQAIEGLIWLEQNRSMDGKILIADCGMDDEGRTLVQLAVKKHKKIIICKAEDVGQWIVEKAETVTT